MGARPEVERENHVRANSEITNGDGYNRKMPKFDLRRDEGWGLSPKNQNRQKGCRLDSLIHRRVDAKQDRCC